MELIVTDCRLDRAEWPVKGGLAGGGGRRMSHLYCRQGYLDVVCLGIVIVFSLVIVLVRGR